MVKKVNSLKVVVAGDISINWFIALSSHEVNTESFGSINHPTCTYWQRGGAALLADLISCINKILPRENQFDLRSAAAPKFEITPCDNRFPHFYTTWLLYKFNQKDSFEKEAAIWRIERFLGFDQTSSWPLQKCTWMEIGKDDPEANLLILDDSNLGFRDCPEYWPMAIKEKGHKPWIILKMSYPLTQGKLWEELSNCHSDRLITVANINEIRRSAVQISRQISWERTTQDLIWELTHNPQVNAFSQCNTVLISFNSAGVVRLNWEDTRVNARLFFDSPYMEGEFEQQHPGKMIGYATCLAAALAHQIVINYREPNIDNGVQNGIMAMRSLHAEGFGKRGTPPSGANLSFPFERISKIITQNNLSLSAVEIPDPARFLYETPESESQKEQTKYWSILEDQYTNQLESIARRTVVEGYENILRDVPIGKFGALTCLDRREIEAFHSIQRLIQEYCRTDQKHPLSIAVFGPPGSGKSFGVAQVAKSVLGQISELNFNLSQFNSVNDLHEAFHRVRDETLSGKIPLVFWDEFDGDLNGSRLGWLRHFLSPMQDGCFQAGQITHPIGRCIFIFAGGTSQTMKEFESRLEMDERQMVKLPDFTSRLKGFLNILGPNPIQNNGSDPYYILRRAIILRSLIERSFPGIFQKNYMQIDVGVLRGFLQTRYYKYGVRSIEAILTMSTLAGKSTYERSSLPTDEQLNLHVDSQDFLALVHRIELVGGDLERMAEAVHNIFCESQRSKGFVYGARMDSKKKTHCLLKSFSELTEDEKEQNRANVRDIPAKLALAGYIMRPARNDDLIKDFPKDDLEKLSEFEHKRYMAQKLAAGWKYAPKSDKSKKLNNTLVDWNKLPEEEKEKDRDMVRGIPVILARAGYAIEKIKPI